MTTTPASHFRTAKLAALTTIAAAAAIALIGLLAWSNADAAEIGITETPVAIAAAAFAPTAAPDLSNPQSWCSTTSSTKRSLGQTTVVNGVTYQLYEYTNTRDCGGANDGTVRYRGWEAVT